MIILLLGSLIAALLTTVLVLQIISLKRKPEDQTASLRPHLDFIEKSQERVERLMREESGQSRTEMGATLKQMTDSLDKKFTALRGELTQHLTTIRHTVDEKLQTTLEKRLGESFKQVSHRLEQVYKGLGEMQTLAAGVGDLKKVLTNVKVRGTWGEVQLGNLLEQLFSPDQYERNVATKKGSNNRVEFAINMPGRGDQKEERVWLPIDAKFPQEDYLRLLDATQQADAEAVEAAARQLEQAIKREAKSICEKYINPPQTTDFAILFLPTEGLYAEVLRRPGIVELLQREYRVNITGPTTLAAMLNSLQMGFRSLAIQRRSSEVWQVLAGIKLEFEKFGQVLTKVQKKLQEASHTIDNASTRTRVIERKLRKVEVLPEQEDALALTDWDEND